MQENKEEWMKLCAQAAHEQDPEKLMALILQINVKERGLKGRVPSIDLSQKPTD